MLLRIYSTIGTLFGSYIAGCNVINHHLHWKHCSLTQYHPEYSPLLFNHWRPTMQFDVNVLEPILLVVKGCYYGIMWPIKLPKVLVDHKMLFSSCKHYCGMNMGNALLPSCYHHLALQHKLLMPYPLISEKGK